MSSLAWAVDARMAYHGGIGTYIRHLVQALTQEKSEKHLCLLGWPEPLLQHSSVCHQRFAAPIYSFQEQMFLPDNHHRSLLWHSPHFNIPLQWSGRLAVTIHDLIPAKFPEYTRSPLARTYTRYMLQQVRKKAAVIIAVSEATKREFCEVTSAPEAAVAVIPHGVDPAVFKATDPGAARQIFDRHNVKPPFILWVSAIRPHKNPQILLRAFKQLRQQKKIPHSLVMIGQRPDWYPLPIEGEGVSWIPTLPYHQLPVFYQGASVLAMPSRQEGFGFPVLEAMANGLPVVASRIPALTELIGNAGVTVDPDEVDAWSDNLYNVLFHDDLRRNLAQMGRQRASRYTWQQSAVRHLQLFGAVLSADRHRS